jgi:Vitelline membrane outer layer protein I (VOMI)
MKTILTALVLLAVGAGAVLAEDVGGSCNLLCNGRAGDSSLMVFAGAYGSWGECGGCPTYCPAGSFAYSMRLKSEASQGSGDDTALNAISLGCYNKTTGAFTGWISDQVGPWGTWGAAMMCTGATVANPITGGALRSEAVQGSGDDTSANAASARCKDGTTIKPAAKTSWGTWSTTRVCPSGTAVCGLQTRVESSQGSGDDTALNGYQLMCCPF